MVVWFFHFLWFQIFSVINVLDLVFFSSFSQYFIEVLDNYIDFCSTSSVCSAECHNKDWKHNSLFPASWWDQMFHSVNVFSLGRLSFSCLFNVKRIYTIGLGFAARETTAIGARTIFAMRLIHYDNFFEIKLYVTSKLCW